MNKLKVFLCTLDPTLAALNIITLALLGLLVYLKGLVFVLTVFTVGLAAGGVLFVIGFGIYKGIVYAQSKCKVR